MGQSCSALFEQKASILRNVESENELWMLLQEMSYQQTDRAEDLPLKAKSYVCAYYNHISKDVFGPFSGESGWDLVKRRYVFKRRGFSLFILHCLQVTICLFVALTHLEFYHRYALLVALVYIGAKFVQGEQMILRAVTTTSFRMSERFLELFPQFSPFKWMVQLSFVTMSIGTGCSCAVADTTPSLSIHGMFHMGTSMLIAYCGIANGISSGSAFSAIASFVAFRFIGDFDELFVDRMVAEASVEQLVEGLKPQDGWMNYAIFLAGYAYCLCVGCALVLYPLILRATGVV